MVISLAVFLYLGATNLMLLVLLRRAWVLVPTEKALRGMR
jgi:hypothetical protein